MPAARELTYRGRTQSIRAWARELGIHEATIRSRLRRGMPVARALVQKAVYSPRGHTGDAAGRPAPP